MAIASLRNVSAFDSSFLGESQCPVSRRWGEIERPKARASTLIQMWREIEGDERMGSNGVKIHSLRKSPIKIHSLSNGAENSPQIEQVSDRLLVKTDGNGDWKGCRALRGLRGRQAVLDLLLKAQMERKAELQCLMESRPVSDFAYRNRIQSLLRGRFLRNDRLIRDERSASVAASEICLLRQRQTVSHLREGFLSRLALNEQSDRLGDMNQHQNTVETAETSERSLEHEGYGQEETLCLQCDESIHNRERDASQNSGGLCDANESSLDNFAMDDSECQLPKDHQTFDKYHDQNGESNDVHKMYGVVDGSEVNSIYDFDWQEEELVTEQEEIDWEQLFGLEFSEWEEDSNNEWHGNAIQESLDDVASRQNAVPVRSYIQDDNNVYSMELKELLSRRRVSNLLQSGFRERLDLLIQSYVERQEKASFDHDQQQQNGYQDESDINDIERINFPLTSSPDSLSRPLWDQESLQDSDMLCYNLHPRPRMEREMINELRIEMERLQQKMNNMQRMVETCMDMQIELHHSVQHEVFAALNRYDVPKDGNTREEDNLLKDEPNWDNVRKGICCL